MDRYEEALEKARELHGTVAAGRDFLAEIFPELRESEDERIRKAIMEVLKRVSGATDVLENQGTTFKKAMIWLEKQKAKERLDRMAPIYNDKESFESALEKAWKYYNESASRTVDSFEDDYIECVFSKGFREGFLYKEKQKELPTNEEMLRTLRAEYEKGVADTIAKYERKEQKFTEKQDYSDLTDLERAIHRGFLVVGVENVPVTIIKETAQDCLAWMKPQKGANGNEKEIPNEQKPAEWSEEDEKNLNEIIHFFESLCSSLATEERHAENRRWLKFLKSLPERLNLQPKQEWSEEEIRTILDDFSECKDTYISCVNRLKSLRPQPHWRPSEEQMGTLKQWIQDHELDGDSRYVYPIFYSLFADLQKLL